jgi:hypothetical protein
MGTDAEIHTAGIGFVAFDWMNFFSLKRELSGFSLVA